MMKLALYLNKSIEENASFYFDRAKRAKKKIEGAKETVESYQKKRDKVMKKKEIEEKKRPAKKTVKEKRWFEKFRWFRTSEGFLVIGGRDATTNEMVIKKHTDANDIIFHTKMEGSPFFVIKTDNKVPKKESIDEAAIATLTFSRAWKLNLSTGEVFHVNPSQVSKTPNPGEYLPRGAFMIRGRMNIMHPTIECMVGTTADGLIMAGPRNAVKKECSLSVEVKQGKEKASQIAKKIKQKIGGEIDDIIRVLPTGGYELVK